MGLIKCPDCGAMISEHAVACPTCGCPAEYFNANPQPADYPDNGYDGNEQRVRENAEYIQSLLRKYCQSDGGSYHIYK